MSAWDEYHGQAAVDDRRRDRFSREREDDAHMNSVYDRDEERERYEAWEKYERERAEWERRRDELEQSAVGGYDYGYERPLKRRRSPSPIRDRYPRPRYDYYDSYGRDRGYSERAPLPDDRFYLDRERDRSPDRRRRSLDRRPRESLFPDPMQQDKLVTFRAFTDWFRDVYPDRFREEELQRPDDVDSNRKVGLRARYEEYKIAFNAKQVRTLFERHRKTAWFLEKYDPRDPYLDLRNRVRKTGWEGAIDKWISELEEGKHDPVPDPATPAIARSSSIPANGNAIAAASTSGETNDNPSKSGPSETPKREDQEDRDDESGDERERGPQDGDEIIIPQKGHQIMIKTIPPDIGRLRLEPLIKTLDGVQSLALGEPVARRQYYRSAWIEFDTAVNARKAMDRLSTQEVDAFRLHVSQIHSPLISKIKVTSVIASEESRLEQDLDTIRKLVATLEKEADMLARYVPTKVKEEKKEEPQDVKIEVTDVPIQEANGHTNGHVDNFPPADRGSAALEARLTKILPPEQEESAKYRRLAMAVDLYLAYLRIAFHCCYYCAVVADRADELQRKCVKHVRGVWSATEMSEINKSSKRKERDYHWLMCHDDKIACIAGKDTVEPIKYGGKSYDDELPVIAKDHYRQEEEQKFRCFTCGKMFKSAGYVCKHISNKHPELLRDNEAMYEFRLYNNFALDPHRIQMPPPFNVPPNSRLAAHRDSVKRMMSPPRRLHVNGGGGPRKSTPPPNAKLDPRASLAAARVSYQDLDEVVGGGEDVALMY